MSIPGPTTYADLHPGEPTFKERMAIKNPGTIYDHEYGYGGTPYRTQTAGTTVKNVGYEERLATMQSLIGSDKPAGSYNGVTYSGKRTWAEIEGYTPKTESVFDTIFSSTAAPGGTETPVEYQTQPVIGSGGVLGAITPVSGIDTPETVAPGDSPTSSIAGAAVAGIAALILLSLLK